MKKNLQLLCAFAFAITTCTAQETTEPVINKSNRIILHFDDTTGIFNQLGRILIDRGYDIEWKDREFGILRTRPAKYYSNANYHSEIKSIFRDSTVTLYAHTGYSEINDEVKYTIKKGIIHGLDNKIWAEMMKMAEMLKPQKITYTRVEQSRDRDEL
jgi:hypothetical protein